MCKCGRSSKAQVVERTLADGIELMIIITSTFAQAMAGSGPAVNIIGVLTLWRFIMGVGIGGDYPLSAVISSEFAATRSRGRLMTAVFASQGWGYLGKRALRSPRVLLTAASFHHRDTGHLLRIRRCHSGRLADNPPTHRLLLADSRRCRLCPGCRCSLLSTHSSRDSALHYGCRA